MDDDDPHVLIMEKVLMTASDEGNVHWVINSIDFE